MPSSLSTGVTGLVVHQRMLDVVANNLANINTSGYKQRQILFSDLFYSNVAGSEIGSGARISQVRRNLSQGNLDPTGESLDFAIRGQGYFIVNDGSQNFYTRSGAFSLDQNGYLIDPNTGHFVQRFGTLGETDGTNPSFQSPGSSRISVPLGTAIPGQSTANVSVNGNLNVSAGIRSSEVISSSVPLLAGGLPATTGTLLNDLDGNTIDYGPGDSIVVLGTDTDSTAISVTVPVDATTTVNDLINAVSAAFPNSTASVDGAGNIQLTANDTGNAVLTLSLADSAGNAGASIFPIFTTTTEGSDGDIVETSVEVFDVRGDSHTVTMQFERVAGSTWELVAGLDPAEGSITSTNTFTLAFNDNGSLASVDGDGSGQVNLTFNFAGISTAQTLTVSLGSGGTFSGVTHLAADASLGAEQDGFPPGTLADVVLAADGTLFGIASNGRQFPVAQLAIASFRNEQGLISRGDNYLTESPASGEVQIGAAQSGSRGSVAAGQLESANVDIALEFTRLIIAQRGFSANARTITVSAEVLEELTNVVR